MGSLVTATGIWDVLSSKSPVSNFNLINNAAPAADTDIKCVRVLKTVLDENDIPSELWQGTDKSQALYGVFFQDIYSPDLSLDISRFAYCSNSNFRHLPLKNEIVSVRPGTRLDRSTSNPVNTLYWTEIIPAWNVPECNFWPLSTESNSKLDPEFGNEEGIAPLQLSSGDISIEGRHGNSIRFGGSYKDGNPLTLDNSKNSPYIIIRNGQGAGIEDNSSAGTVYESIDKDLSSIYLTSNQAIPLTEEANTKKDSWMGSAPADTSTYKEAQVLLNSDRIFLNARKQDLGLAAKENIEIGANKVGIDGKEFISVDADKIYLGAGAKIGEQPVLLGTTTCKWLEELCSNLNFLLSQIELTKTEAQLAALSATAGMIKQGLSELKSNVRLDELQSKKSFVE